MKTRSVIELLEGRIAPAALLTFIDADGDSVTIKTSKGTNADLAPLITTEASGMGVAIREIDLSKASSIFDGTDLSVLVTKAVTGDGLVNIRYIDAVGFTDGNDMNLGRVIVQGDLGSIDAGRNDGNAITSLKLTSFGVADAAMNGFIPEASFLKGGVGSVAVAGAMKSVQLNFGSASSISVGIMDKAGFFAVGNVASARIGVMDIAALEGGTLGKIAIGSMTSTARIESVGAITRISINSPVNEFSEIKAGSIGALTVKGGFGATVTTGLLKQASILGDFTGRIEAGTLGTLRISGDVTGAEDETGYISVAGNVTSIRVTGDVLGGLGKEIGFFEIGGNAGSIRIGGSLKGISALTGAMPMTEADDNGAIRVGGNLAKVFIGGDVFGTSVLAAGQASDTSGAIIVQGNLGSAVIGGSIRAGAEDQGDLQSSGTIQVGKNLGSFLVKGDVLGSSSDRVFITALGADGPGTALAIGKITILGEVRDTTIRAGDDGSEILNNNQSPDEQIGTVQVGGNFIRSSVLAGAPSMTNAPEIHSKIARIVIGGTATGGDPMAAYGFRAEEIGSFRMAGKNFVLSAGELNDPKFNLDPVGNTILHETQV